VAADVPRSLIIIPDLHIPWHHARGVAALIEFCYDRRPQMAVQLGDAYDMYSASSYAKKHSRMRGHGGTLFEEAQSGTGFWLNLLASCDSVHYIPGNHEDRLHRNIVEANPALAGHPALELPSVLLLPQGVNTHPVGTKLRVGNIIICHGDQLLGRLDRRTHPALDVLRKYPNQHTVFGHTHKIATAGQVVYNYDRPRTFAAWNIGWLGDHTQVEYETDPLWRLGFAYVEFWSDGDGRQRFTFYQIEMVDGRFSWGGKVYGD